MTQPLLNHMNGHSVRERVRCESPAELVKRPFTGELRPLYDSLQFPQEVTLRPTVLIHEDRPAVRIQHLIRLQSLYEIVRERNLPRFVILDGEAHLRLFVHRVG